MLAGGVGLLALAGALHATDLTVGSKRFTESYILGEIVARTAQRVGEAEVQFRPGLGNTAIVYQALKSGAIDVYPEYTGTIALEILKQPAGGSLDALNAALAPLGLAAGVRLGFSNTYALAMRETEAARLGVRRVSDLAAHPELQFGLSQEFLHRRDGWPGLKTAYGLPFAPRGLDHGLAFEALAAGRVDVTDVYSTDAKIARYGLRVLEDDRAYFPAYDALLLYRSDLPRRLPRTWAALARLEGGLTATRMVELNAAVELQGQTFAVAADTFLAAAPSMAAGALSVAAGAAPTVAGETFFGRLFGPDFWRLAREHAVLVLVSLAASIAVGVPLGVWAARAPRAGSVIFAVVGVLQTVPALALLAFLVAAFNRIGMLPALGALFFYGLLPIVRNTAEGFTGVSAGLRAAALALGLQTADRLRLIELPLALPTIFAGIKTSAVIGVGTATIAAFIGAGGFGERIVAGLAVNDHDLLLAGALPAAALALATQWLFDRAERAVVSPGLRPAVR
ncbi:MAG: glycine betaine ABC transporter substrate-binding protein [Burkholderiales bacterium]